MANLLSQRLKSAKQELTDLKTVHGRGLGLLKVYSITGEANPPTNANYSFRLIISFDRDFASMPLTNFLRYTTNPTAQFMQSSLEIDDEYYSNDGYDLVIEGYYSDWDIGNRGYKIVSMSPIAELRWEWTLDG